MNAERNGAAAVLIADNVCLCKDENCRNENQYDTCEDSEPTMADDGSGGDVSIPSFLLFKHDADRMKKMLQGGSSIQVEMTWKLPNPDKRVEYSLWSVPTDSLSQDFLRSFKQVAVKLDKQAHFTPRMYIYDGKQAGCVGRDLNCANLCTNNGRYCATDPDNDINRGISGADVVTESLRRLCIWKEYGESDGIGREWWDYIEEFYERCHTYTKFNDIDCVDDAMRRAKVNRDHIRTCMRSSGGLEGDKPNSVLDLEIQARNDKGVVILPTVTVNGVPLRGALTSTNIFDAICSGYAPGTRPDICAQCSNCNNVASCVNNNGICLSGTTGRGGSSARTAVVPKGRVSSGTFVFSMLLIVGAFAGAGFWYYQRSREEMRDHVRGILAEYMPLEDQDGNGLGQAMMGGPGATAGPAGGATGVGMPGFVTNVGQSFNNMTSQFTG